MHILQLCSNKNNSEVDNFYDHNNIMLIRLYNIDKDDATMPLIMGNIEENPKHYDYR